MRDGHQTPKLIDFCFCDYEGVDYLIVFKLTAAVFSEEPSYGFFRQIESIRECYPISKDLLYFASKSPKYLNVL